MSTTIDQGSILDSKADCIVNPANSFLNHGGGLAAIIERTATQVGWSAQTGLPNAADRAKVLKWRRDHANAPLIATGGAYATSAGVLPYKAVIHAVGPVWGGGAYLERSLLASAHDRAISVARDRGYGSIAFPAISCGVFGYPVEKAALIAVNSAIRRQAFIDVEFWLFEEAHVEAYQEAIVKLTM